MRVTFSQAWNEPAPQKHYGIFCKTCKSKIASKAVARQAHKGHEAVYLNEDGSFRD